MLLKAKDLVGYSLKATDGAIGTIDDLLIDDREWSIRWITADTGTWLHSRKVLLPPESFGEPDHVSREIPIDLDRKRIEDSPSVERDQPVSRQVEADIYDFYGYPPYWGHVYGAPAVGVTAAVPLAATGLTPTDARQTQQATPTAPAQGPASDRSGNEQDDSHLRSANEVIGYYIEATDGSIGHVEDILIDSGDWATRYLMIDTRNWWPGRLVLVSPRWASEVSWTDRKVFLDTTRDRVRSSPEYDPEQPIDRSYEERLHTHYGYEPHWHR